MRKYSTIWHLFFLVLFSTIIFAQTGKLHYALTEGNWELKRSNTDGTSQEILYTPSGTGQITAIAIDVNNDKLYFADRDRSGPNIFQCDLDGSNRVSILSVQAQALLVVGSKLYYALAEGSWDLIRCNLDGTSQEILYTPSGTGQITAIAVDVSTHKLYFTDMDGSSPNIFKCDLDGSNRVSVLSVKAQELAVYNSKLYFALTEGNWELRRSNLDGTSQEILYTPSGTGQVDGLTYNSSEDKLYFIDKDGGSSNIYKSDLDGSNRVSILSVAAQAITNYNDPMLPVELTSFVANVSGDNLELKWQTATEVNNYGFAVERRPETGDWKEVGFVEGAGNSNTAKAYSFEDLNLNLNPNLTLVYRLKQIDLDGKFTYSKEVEVQLENVPSEFALEQNYPNPFNPTTKIKYSVAPVGANNYSPVRLIVYNLLGQEVATLVNKQQTAGNYEVEFDGSSLTSGIYMYKLKAGDFVSVKRFILMK